MLRSRHLAKTDISAGNRSIGRSLVLYWLCMALAMLAAALLLLSVTGVFSRTARQFGETAALQQNNNAALFTAQMDALFAQGIELSETVSGELERFLASRSLKPLAWGCICAIPVCALPIRAAAQPASGERWMLHEQTACSCTTAGIRSLIRP